MGAKFAGHKGIVELFSTSAVGALEYSIKTNKL